MQAWENMINLLYLCKVLTYRILSFNGNLLIFACQAPTSGELLEPVLCCESSERFRFPFWTGLSQCRPQKKKKINKEAESLGLICGKVEWYIHIFFFYTRVPV